MAIRSVTVKIKEKGGGFLGKTINISPSGAYCRTASPMPLLSKVAITLVVPIQIEGKRVNKTIDCGGTIVRTHPVIVGDKTVGYDVAIFFSELKKEDRKLISEYINYASSKEKKAL